VDFRHAAHELADLELVGNNDAAVIPALLGIATRFTHEVCHIERDERSSVGDGEVELLTVRRLTMSGLVRAEGVKPAPP
jgi:hypothetical protein